MEREGRGPRILLVAPWYWPRNTGGAPRLFDMMASHSDGLEFFVLADGSGDPGEQQAFDSGALKRGYTVLRKPLPMTTFPRGLSTPGKFAMALRDLQCFRRSVMEAVEETGCDVVIMGQSRVCGWLSDALPSHVRCVQWVHGEELTMEEGRGPMARWLIRRQRRALRKADRVIAVSSYSAEQVTNVAGTRPAQISVLPNAVDVGRFQAPQDREALRRQFGFDGHTVLLSVARLVPRKGLDQVLRALAELRQQPGALPDNWRYIMAGDGPERDHLQRLVRELDLQDRVEMRGFAPEMMLPSLYGAADVFIMPNRCINGDTEGFGIVFLEASACGAPVIGGIAGGTAEAIADGVSGYRIDGEDIGALANAISRLACDPELRRQMGEAGRQRVEEGFTATAHAGRLLDILAPLVPKAGRQAQAEVAI